MDKYRVEIFYNNRNQGFTRFNGQNEPEWEMDDLLTREQADAKCDAAKLKYKNFLFSVAKYRRLQQ